MDRVEFSTAEREALQYWRFHPPHPRVQRKMEVLYLKSQGLAVPRFVACVAFPARPARYVRAYRSGGIPNFSKLRGGDGRVSWQITGPAGGRLSPAAARQ